MVRTASVARGRESPSALTAHSIRRQRPKRVRLWNIDRLLMVWLYRLYPSLLDAIVIVQPETMIRWHRRGFRAYWRWQSRHVVGRPRIDSEVRALIRRMNCESMRSAKIVDVEQFI
jgi:hypothetical protein